MATTNSFNLLQGLITSPSFTPIPNLPTAIFPLIPAINKRTQPTFINPLTNKVNTNSYSNRYRINKDIEARNAISRRNIATINTIQASNLAVNNRTQTISATEFSNQGKIRVRNDNNTSTQDFYNWIRSIKNTIPTNNPWQIKNVTLYWVKSGRTINRTMSIAEFEFSYDSFLQRYNEIKTGGDTEGSDAGQHIEEVDWIFESAYADLWFVKGIVANATGVRTIFNIHGINLKSKDKKDCINKSMDVIGYPDMKLNTVNTLLAYIKSNNLPIRVISNILTKLSPKAGSRPELVQDAKSKRLALYKIKTDCDYEINELYKPDVFIHTLLYCPVDKHVDIIKDNNIQMLDEVYSTSFRDIYKIIDGEYQKIYTVDNVYKHAPEPKQKMRQLYVCFDYETIIDWECDNVMKPYSLSWFWFDHAQMEEHLLDNEALTKYYRDTSNRQSHIGFDCSAKFLKWILDNQNNTIMRFIGFNSANFDNYLLFTAIMDYKVNTNKDDFTIGDLLYNGSQMLSFKVNGRHTPYDIRKHLVGSLSANCDSFKVPNEFSKISGFSHDAIQQLYNDDKANFINAIKDNEEITKYNDNDVLSLGYLFIKYYKAMTNIDPVKFSFLNGEEFVQYGTIGGIIMKIAELHWEKTGIKLPKLDITKYRDVLRGKSAGRVDLFTQAYPKLMEEIVSMDVCSLYPYIMAIFPGFFPCGDILETDIYIEPTREVSVRKFFAHKTWHDESELRNGMTLEQYALTYGAHNIKTKEVVGNIGFWYCDIDQRTLKSHNLPNILPQKIFKINSNGQETGDCLENKWDSDQLINNVLISNITIELLKKYQSYGVTVNIKKGFYFTESVKSIEMFEFLMPLMAMKNREDTLKKQKSAEYNPAMRECSKLLMNSISGRVIMGLHTQQIKMITSAEEYIKIDAKYNVNTINSVGNAVFVSYDKTEEELINKQQPIYLGVLIYEYARRYMYETIMAPIGLDRLHYMDTDACKFRSCDVDEWRRTHGNKIVPHWPEVEKYDSRYITHKVYDPESKVFGSFENELDENNVSYFLQKKTWLTAHVKDGRVSYIKCRFKGVNPNSYLLDGSEPFLLDLPFSGKEPEVICEDIELFKWCMDNKHKRIGGDYDGKGVLLNQLALYEQIYTRKYAYILCNNIQRVVKNSRRGVSIDDIDKFNKSNNCVRAQYMVKKIQLN
jgi:hypothetical protein